MARFVSLVSKVLGTVANLVCRVSGRSKCTKKSSKTCSTKSGGDTKKVAKKSAKVVQFRKRVR